MAGTSTRPAHRDPTHQPSAPWGGLPPTVHTGTMHPWPGLMDLIDHRADTEGGRTYLSLSRSARSLSFGDLRRAVVRLDHGMDSQGITSGERVGLAIADPLDFVSAYLGVIATGRWAVPLDPSAPPRATVSAVGRLRPSLILSDRPPPPGTTVPWLGRHTLPGSVRTYDPTAPTTAEGASTSTPVSGGGAVLSSSGSTGAPKVIVLHQRQLLHTAHSIATHHRLSPSDRGFSPLPLFHVNAQVVGVLAALCAGSQLVLDDRFRRTDFWKVMEDKRVTWINAVPAILTHLGTVGPDEVVPSRIRFARSASAPLPTTTLHRFEQATGIPVIETYGMTESASQITANPLDGPRKPGSVGLPVGIELRITDADDERAGELPSGRIGQVEIRGASVDPPSGGWTGDGPGSNAGRIGQWLRSGDYGYLDEDGYLFLVGRRDDVINRGGEKMFPREIEERLLDEPDVEAALVVAEPHEALGQVPVAYLVLRGADGTADGTADVARALDVAGMARDRIAESLPSSRRPVRLHVVDRLPTTTTGKLSRRALSQAGIDPLATLDGR